MDDLQLAYDIELEKTIVGTMITEPSCIAELVGLAPENFTNTTIRKLFGEILRLWNENEELVNLDSLTLFADKQGMNLTILNELISKALPTAHIIKFYADRLEALTSLREAGRLGRQLLSIQSLRAKEDIREALNQAELRMTNITTKTIQNDTLKPFDDVLAEVNEELLDNYESGKGITGIPSGFTDLDRATSGFQRQDLIILAARPSMGKSAFALNVATKMAIEQKKKVAFFNLEMSRKQMAYRMIASCGHINLLKLRSGKLNEDEFYRYTETISELSMTINKNLWLDEQAGITVPEIKAKARKIQREHGLDCIIIDYLGLIEGIKGEYSNRVEEVSKNSRLLKLMAKELNVPVICLCQLSRAVEQRQDKRPMLSDLRESGSIEQDADLVMFLYRDEYYNEDSDRKNIAELIIGKQRNGPTGTIELLFMKDYNKFLPLERRLEE
ncbi:replicative DNA helicase [Thermoactinomyces daqus]|uniref:Replicative DNA helicase n=1 Tax=Thermoactinomyces daqus TaxID=1329516 RepID=A0A7W2AJ64_9BACL|nr:replicative DNA helicase [Thermoactinomyces daqus]MBA4544486.1 replicative DNA helicase [Thermoactinomyces daqus]